MSDLLTVSMPTYNTDPKLLRRAVKHVLAQDYPNLRLVVINDGGKKISLPKDDRLFRLDLKENRGRYFCDAVTLASLDDGWFAVHDADDWAEQGMYSALMEAAAPHGAALGPYWRHMLNEEPYVWNVRQNPRQKMIAITSWATGVYSVSRMWKAGGIDPTFRVGFDTLHTLLITGSGKVGQVDTPYYHYEKTSNSLTTSGDTGFKTKVRKDAKAKITSVYKRSKILTRRKAPLKNLIYLSAPQSVRKEIDEYAAVLREQYKLAI